MRGPVDGEREGRMKEGSKGLPESITVAAVSTLYPGTSHKFPMRIAKFNSPEG